MGNVVALRRYDLKSPDNETGKSRLSEPDLIERTIREMKLKHFRPSTQRSYLGAVKEFIAYRKRTHAKARGELAMFFYQSVVGFCYNMYAITLRASSGLRRDAERSILFLGYLPEYPTNREAWAALKGRSNTRAFHCLKTLKLWEVV